MHMQFHASKKMKKSQIDINLKKSIKNGRVSTAKAKPSHYQALRVPAHYLHSMFDIWTSIKSQFPKSRTVSVSIISTIIISVLLLSICNVNSYMARVEKDKEALVSENFELTQNVSSMNQIISQSNDKDRVQQETIITQKESEEEIKTELDTIKGNKDSDINRLTDQINKIIDSIKPGEANFDGVVSRSSGASIMSAQLTEAKIEISTILGDTPKAQELIANIDEAKAGLEDYKKRFPDGDPNPNAQHSSSYGYRRDPFTGSTSFHSGLDMSISTGSNVRACGYGVVEASGYDGSLGYRVIINHGYGYKTVYGHNSKLLVEVGDVVEKGQVIALSGSTGRSTGPHIHLEIRKDGVPQNPLLYIRK